MLYNILIYNILVRFMNKSTGNIKKDPTLKNNSVWYNVVRLLYVKNMICS